jgi:hypothetical protein
LERSQSLWKWLARAKPMFLQGFDGASFFRA